MAKPGWVRRGAGMGVGRRAPGGVLKRPPEPAGGQTFFQIFCRAAPVVALVASLIVWNRSNIFSDPLCDDLLTIGVDSPEGGAYNPNH